VSRLPLQANLVAERPTITKGIGFKQDNIGVGCCKTDSTGRHVSDRVIVDLGRSGDQHGRVSREHMGELSGGCWSQIACHESQAGVKRQASMTVRRKSPVVVLESRTVRKSIPIFQRHWAES